MEWQPLFVREGMRASDGPFAGVPEHLVEALKEWLIAVFGVHSNYYRSQLIVQVAAAVRVPITRSPKSGRFDANAVTAMARDEDTLLEAVDACLHIAPVHLNFEYEREAYHNRLIDLQDSLKFGGSVWMIDKNDKGLIRRVGPSAMAAYERATRVDDAITQELDMAWRACFGRSPDSSDSWDHSIKAVETVLKPVVSRNNQLATLGTIIRDLRAQAGQWDLVLSGKRGNGIDVLIGMLQLMWPNPDRHGGPNSRTPTLNEAQAVVHLAVTIVQWARDGSMTKRP